MESFSDAGIILSLRPYLDKGVVVSALTHGHGRHAGFAYKGQLSGVEIGAICDLRWEARTEGQLGTYKTIEVERAIAPLVISDRRKLQYLQSLCAMCDTLLPEREPHTDMYEATRNLLEQLVAQDDALVCGALYVMWEMMLLQTLGYGLDLAQCNATGATADLIYVSPKTGKAVCESAGAAYKDRLLKLPPFLRTPRGNGLEAGDVKDGLKLTETFFDKWVMTHMSADLPSCRRTLSEGL